MAWGSESRFLISPAGHPEVGCLSQMRKSYGSNVVFDRRDASNRYQKVVLRRDGDSGYFNLRYDAWGQPYMGIQDGQLKMVRYNAQKCRFRLVVLAKRSISPIMGPWHKNFDGNLDWDAMKGSSLKIAFYHEASASFLSYRNGCVELIDVYRAAAASQANAFEQEPPPSYEQAVLAPAPDQQSQPHPWDPVKPGDSAASAPESRPPPTNPDSQERAATAPNDRPAPMNPEAAGAQADKAPHQRLYPGYDGPSPAAYQVSAPNQGYQPLAEGDGEFKGKIDIQTILKTCPGCAWEVECVDHRMTNLEFWTVGLVGGYVWCHVGCAQRCCCCCLACCTGCCCLR
mmetsp:Transcript_39503/g.61601  ORF Transcript_39503/g.61601 Transcript_39503/m.61601 type:complete len:342 (-) Transcript_39503:1310-2335(-)